MNHHAAELAPLYAMPTPSVRRLHATLDMGTGRTVPGTIDVLDYGSNGAQPMASVSALVNGQMLHLGWGEVQGLQPQPPANRGGRPKKTARDMAVYLAFRWHSAALQQKCPGARADGKARDSVCELWQQKGYKGLSDERKVRNIVSRVSEQGCVKSGSVAAFMGEADGVGRVSLLMKEGGRVELSENRILMEGWAWLWPYGEETATYTHISGEGELRRHGHRRPCNAEPAKN